MTAVVSQRRDRNVFVAVGDNEDDIHPPTSGENLAPVDLQTVSDRETNGYADA